MSVSFTQIPNSSNVEACGYDAERRELYVQFKNGATYAYEGCGESEYQGLLAADSPGRYVNEVLKGNYRTRRV